MTVNKEIPTVTKEGDGVTSLFPFTFSYQSANKEYNSKLIVYIKRDGQEQETLDITRYKVIPNSAGNGGEIEFPVLESDTALLVGDVITIDRETDINQGLLLTDAEAVNNTDLMGQLDKTTRQQAEQKKDLDRAVKVPPTSDISPDELIESIEEAVVDSAASAAAAKISEDNAKVSEDNAAISAQEASDSAAGVNLPSAVADTFLYQPPSVDGYITKSIGDVKTILGVDTNATNIGTNTTNIGTNAGNIATNTANIHYDEGDIFGGVDSNAEALTSDIPSLTANVDQGYTCSGSSTVGGLFDYYQAYNEDEVFSANAPTGHNIIQLPVAKSYKTIGIRARGAVGEEDTAPQDMIVDLSNTGLFAGEEETVLNFSGETNWAAGEIRYFAINPSIDFEYYKTNATLNNGDVNFVQWGVILLEEEITGSSLQKIDISSVKARSSDDLLDFKLGAGSLDVTTDWIVIPPSLINLVCSNWIDNNSGNPRFILDDINGSNIAGSKRYLGSFLTDSSGDIIPLSKTEFAGGWVEVEQEAIEDLNTTTDMGAVWNTIKLSVPPNTYAKIKVVSDSSDGVGSENNQFRIRDNFIGNELNYDTSNTGRWEAKITDTIYIKVDSNSEIEYWYDELAGTPQAIITTLGWKESRV